MHSRWLLAVLAMVVLQADFAICQSRAPSIPMPQAANPPGSEPFPTWLPLPIPLKLYQYWRKYGPWDSKQQGFKFRDFGLYNFGATGAAAGLDQNALVALSEASKPKPADLKDLEERTSKLTLPPSKSVSGGSI